MRGIHRYVLIHGILSKRLLLEMKVDKAYLERSGDLLRSPGSLCVPVLCCIWPTPASQRPGRARKHCNIACAAWFVGIALTT